MISRLFEHFNWKERTKDQSDILCDEIQDIIDASIVYISSRYYGGEECTFCVEWLDVKAKVRIHINDMAILGKVDNAALYLASTMTALRIEGHDIWINIEELQYE